MNPKFNPSIELLLNLIGITPGESTAMELQLLAKGDELFSQALPLPWKDETGVHYAGKFNEANLAQIVAEMNQQPLSHPAPLMSELLDLQQSGMANIDYALPQCFKGNPHQADLYCCMLNPGSSVADTQANIHSYAEYYQLLKAKNDHRLALNPETGQYDVAHIVAYMNDFETVMYREMTALKQALDTQETITKKFIKASLNTQAYYLSKYYKTAISDGLDDLVNNIYQAYRKDKLTSVLQKIASLKICNLELTPVRSQKFAALTDATIAANRFSILTILRRICLYEVQKEITGRKVSRPVFVFRSYKIKSGKRWYDYFTAFFKEEGLDEATSQALLAYLETNYFLKYKTQNCAISYNNITSISGTSVANRAQASKEEQDLLTDFYQNIVNHFQTIFK
ncbi:hypothetical protein [Enterococcus cecorum]|uniref:hypothetical protein n=1 Tax=Enterococcus cecorum TaxID=44008 RepID=UPI001FAE45BC|nr:hypothetical protein [Enterococcus cecorum]MCJ0537949.1 hypothetical protein [Enterococcus cecorum]MCJ0545599.1 hypothetical protein [Enterococcus cecorum]MCJ0550886.1 hypothetical protein [Enterococcus cecorum]MCJ0568647.1 hypothetical protein [Enterococcus cecorum]